MSNILSRPASRSLGEGGSVGDGQGVEEDFGEDQGMSDSVPNGWSMVEFDSFTTLQRGKDLTKAEFRYGTVPVAGSNGVIGYHDTAIAKAPGVTVGRSGSAGKVTVYEEDFWPHNTSLYVRDFHGNDPYYAGFLLGSLNLSRFKTGASVPTLDRNSFKTLPILVPPLPEQKKIAHILSTVQRAIEAQDRITNEFMVHWMMFAFLLTNTYGVTGTRTTIAHLPEIKLKPLSVPVSSLDEQAEIAKALFTVDSKLAVHQGTFGALQNLLRTLLHELMTAKIRVHDIEFQIPFLRR